MRVLLFSALLIACTYAYDDNEEQQVQQLVQSVKGGQGSWQPFSPSSADLVKIFEGKNNYNYGYNMRDNLTAVAANVERDVGVCYIEVPTASLVHSGQVPVGNGSQPHLSRIRSCCKGYIRNIHNYWKCDPVCTAECVNALCTAPEVCTCFPDHVKNLASFCIPTCPIGCQNGQCSGGQCICKEGYKLHNGGKFCVPVCNENCGGIGNCTAPNTCDCRPGYHSGPEGSCKPVCDNKCANGDCIAPNECRCHQGFTKNAQGLCAPQCLPGYQPTPQGCKPFCNQCDHGECVGPNECRCNHGYTKNRQGQCVPECIPDCGPTSRCVSPNVCDPPIPKFPVQPNQPNNYQPQQPNSYQPSPYQPRNPLYPDSQVLPQPDGVAQCAQPCLNGVCVGQNQCRCNPGYVNDAVNPNMCVPSCPGGCPNGICSAPNFCICNPGYVKDHSVKGRPTCVKRAKRSIDDDSEKPINIAELLIFEIPDY